MTFYRGQKVVRVGSKNFPMQSHLKGRKWSSPQIGEVCTVSTINHWPRVTLITLREHDNSHLINGSGFEPGFDASCFRPVVTRATDISVFTKVLKTTEAAE
jgi:hypothetical protein